MDKNKMQEEELTPELLEEMEDLQRDQSDETREDGVIEDQNWRDAYGAPEPEEKFGQHAFLAKTLEFTDSERVTFLSESELGNPHFSVRFLLDLEDVSGFYLDTIAKSIGVENKIQQYFRDKINNICSSGMSNQGFIQNMNVSRRIDVTRKKVQDNIKNLQGGKK